MPDAHPPDQEDADAPTHEAHRRALAEHTPTPDPTSPFAAVLTAAVAPWGFALEPVQRDRLERHYHAMIAANRRMNLTRITEPRDAAVKHYADSLAVWSWSRRRNAPVRTVLDVGTGAGFPAVPLAVVWPDVAITAIDGTNKKIAFVKDACRSIGLDNLTAVHARAERWDSGATFDMVVVRAVAPLATVLAHAHRRVARDGYFIAYKTASLDEQEARDGLRVAARRGLVLHERFPYALTCEDATLRRALYIFRRSSPLKKSVGPTC
ncbi:MAG: 16S rRNA (guanine(527)-N(7))-methyltransferase RsmG [Phycisphaerae bacterium]